MFHYHVAGLTVVSDIALPGLITSGLRAGAPDIYIRHSAVPDTLDGVTQSGPNWQLAGDRLLLRIPNIMRMLLIGGHDILFETDRGVDMTDGAIFLSETGIGILMHQRRRVVLHASAIKVGDSAVLFCGQPGAGTSTLAAAFGQRGYPLVADTICCLTMNGNIAWLEPDGRQHQLWQQSIDALALSERRCEAVRASLQKYFVSALNTVDDRLPVCMIYELHSATPARPVGISRPRSVDGIHLVLRNAYRRALVDHLGQRQLYFDTAATLMATGRLLTFTRMMDFAENRTSLSGLETHWRDRGLLVEAD